MEVVVATGIFGVVTLASLSIYMAALRTSQETLALTRVQREAQFIMEVLAKKIRTSQVNYDYSGYNGTVVNPTDNLALIDSVGDDFLFSLNAETNSIQVTVNEGTAREIPAANVAVNNLEFFINPTSNPFVSLDNPPTSHPYVTVVMEVHSTQADQEASLIIQQTIPQRSGLIMP